MNIMETVNKYQRGQIYTIRSYQTDMFYIGSTYCPLAKRIYKHRQNYKDWKKGNHNFISSYDILKYDDHYIELLEEFPCENKKQLNKREGQHIRSNDKCVNKRVEGRTHIEWLQDHKQDIKEYNKIYYASNNEDHECECGGHFRTKNKPAHEKSLLHQNYLEKLKE